MYLMVCRQLTWGAYQGAEPSASCTSGDDTSYKVETSPLVSEAEDTRYGPDQRSLTISGGIASIEGSLDQDPKVRFFIFYFACVHSRLLACQRWVS